MKWSKDRATRHKQMASLLRAGLAYQVRGLREKHGWTRRQLYLKSGVSPHTIKSIEEGTRKNISTKSLEKIATAFNVALIVRFVAFSEVYEFRAIPLSFGDDPAFKRGIVKP